MIYKLKKFADGSFKEVDSRPVIRGSYSGKRVLLAEDNQLNREIVVEILSDAGVAVETAENGKAAVAKMTESPEGTYDLIFMDMQMPVMDGCTASEKIRMLPRKDVK